MRAMIFAAGLGTRLYPFTQDRPKALVSVGGQTLIERCIRHLMAEGVRQIVVNVYHYGQQIIDFLRGANFEGLDIRISNERELLLETGGGLLRAVSILQAKESFVAINVDIISNVNLGEMMRRQVETQALATLAVRERASARQLLFDERGELCAWENQETGEKKIAKLCDRTQKLAFSGIQIISPRWFDLVHRRGKFSIIDTYLDLADKEPIFAFRHDNDYWFDVGKPDSLADAEAFLLER